MSLVEGTGAQPFTDDLDGQLMFRQWESAENLEAYREAVNEGKLPHPDATTYRASTRGFQGRITSTPEELKSLLLGC